MGEGGNKRVGDMLLIMEGDRGCVCMGDSYLI